MDIEFKPKVSVCILNWNTCHILKKALPIFFNEARTIDLEIIVFDQNSSDGSKEYLQSCPHIIPIFSSENVGNSISRNEMIKKAKGELVLLIDGDITPIPGSVKAMAEYLEKDENCVCLGYDCINNYQKTITLQEKKIENKDVFTASHKMALTQYGLFKKHIFAKLQFPEFYPFDRPGWGGEDNILGYAISNYGYTIKSIAGRKYEHNRHTSWDFLDEDYNFRMQTIRVIYTFYFGYLLTLEEQIDLLKSGKIKTVALDIEKYYWNGLPNLGDLSFNYLLEKFCPFLQFSENSENVVLIGGTVMEHPRTWKKKYKEILYFGTGVHTNDSISPEKCNSAVFPRGEVTKNLLLENHFENVYPPIGDTAFLFSCEPKLPYTKNNRYIRIIDAFTSPTTGVSTGSPLAGLNATPNDHQGINHKASYSNYAVCLTKLTKGYPLVNDVDKWKQLIQGYNGVISSQIHPAIISLAFGVPAKLIPKDLRAEDLESVLGVPLNNMPDDGTIMQIRNKMQRLSKHWFMNFMCQLSRFRPDNPQKLLPVTYW